jgi:hypothetical protein
MPRACRRRPCRRRPLRGVKPVDCHDLVDKSWKLLQRYHAAADRVYNGQYRPGEHRPEAVARVNAMLEKQKAMDRRIQELGC